MHLGLQYQGKLRKFADAFTSAKLDHLHAAEEVHECERRVITAKNTLYAAKEKLDAARKQMDDFMDVERVPGEQYYRENGAGV